MDVFGTPYFLLIDMQIGATWMEAPDPNDYPIKMTVDWVKVYELEKQFIEHHLKLMQRCKYFPHTRNGYLQRCILLRKDK